MDTLRTLRDEVLAWWDEVGDAGTTATVVDNAIRRAHHKRVSREKWQFMLYPKQSFFLEQGKKLYTLHAEFGRPSYFHNRTKKEFLEQVPPRQLSDPDIDLAAGTEGKGFQFHGTAPVWLQPSASTKLTISSSSANDNTQAKAVLVRGESGAGGHIVQESITPNGITPVESTYYYSHIISLTLLAAWDGRFGVNSEDDGTLVSLEPGELGRQYQQIQLLWSPATHNTEIIDYEFYRKPSPMTEDNDVPDIPYPHSGILVWDALLMMAAYDNQVEGGRLAIWRSEQQDLEISMQHAYLEPQSIRSRARYVKYMGD